MKVVGQLGMDEEVLDNEELEAALEERWEAAQEKSEPVKKWRLADEKAKGLVKAAVEVGRVVRVGRFRIERKATDPRHVEFDSRAGDRVNITADGDE